MGNEFSESWLRQHQARMAGIAAVQAEQSLPPLSKPPSAMVTLDLDHIVFSIDRCLPLMNGSTGLLRSHWTKRRAYQRALSNEIARLLPVLPSKPIDPALVTITRYGIRLPDDEGLWGSMKPLLDCLVVRCERHPFGLGIIFDDDPAHMTLEVSCVKIATLREQRTEVRIQPLV